jgi:hypothetical protein
MDVSARPDLSAFADAASMPSWAADAMSWAVGTGLIKGRGDSTIAPADSATRAEFATIIMRLLDLDEDSGT